MSRQNPRMTAVLILYFEFLQDMASRHPRTIVFAILSRFGNKRREPCY